MVFILLSVLNKSRYNGLEALAKISNFGINAKLFWDFDYSENYF